MIPIRTLRKFRQLIADERTEYWRNYYERWPEHRETVMERSRRERREREERFARVWNRRKDNAHD
jgi:hypothetical protein